MINVIQLTGAGLLPSVAILTVMITPIMTALITDALASVPRSWHEGAIALGLNPLRATRAVSLRAIRPAIIAATALATARAIGEAIMIDMVSGGNAFTPKPQDGLIFIFEPLRTLASEIIDQAENLSAPGDPLEHLRDRAAADVLRLHALDRVAARAPAAAQVRAEQLMASAEPAARPRLAVPPRRRGRRSSLRSWRLRRPARVRARLGRRASACA